MKEFIKENTVYLLLVTLLALLLILWGRIMVSELKNNGYQTNLTTSEARLNCLSSYGWEVDAGSETQKTVAIPKPLDAVYEAYNSLQTICGFDLKKCEGESAVCYTYTVLNFPYETEEPVYVNVLICDGVLIGGDCMSTAIDGFMLPLDRRYLP